jgi:uncharacterized membrane protein YecN with MAPEG domain
MSEKRKQAGNAVTLIGIGLVLIVVATLVGPAHGAWILGWIFFGAGLLAWKSL